MQDDTPRQRSYLQRHENVAITLGIAASIAAVFLILIGIWVGIKTVGRSQRRADASNQVILNEIQIKQTGQLVEVQKQKAQIKVEEAKGIAEAQKIINQTLTPLYLQHEAIQAQEQMANSPNHTTIYIPSGSNGIPLVQTVNP